jgi:thiamine biosynthesis lipoprotein
MAELEDVMSDYRPRSEVRRLASAAVGRPVRLGPDLCKVIGASLAVAHRSGGAYDPTIKPLVDLWRESRRTLALPEEAALAAARRRVGYRHLRFDSTACTLATDVEGIELDLGGVAKGYILDQSLTVLGKCGVASALIEAGGDIVVSGAPPGTPGWRIAVPHADSVLPGRAASLVNAAISTSGDAEQFIEIAGRRYSHIIDPRTGLGATTGALATVIAPDGMTADVLATALAVSSPAGAAALLQEYPRVIAAVR